MIRALAILAFAVPLSAAAETPARLGDFAYDPTLWRVEQRGDAYNVVFRKSDDLEDAFSVTVAPGAASDCTPKTVTERLSMHDTQLSAIEKPTHKIHVASAWFGCRNARPPSVVACAVYKGRLYRFDSRVLGCGGGPGFSGGVEEFLTGLSAQ